MGTQGTVEEGEPIERSLARFVAENSYADLPDGVEETVIRAFVDTVGVTLAGAASEGGRVMDAVLDRDAAGASAAPAVGPSDRTGITAAALAYGNAAHALDYDDLSWAMDGHPSVVLVPPVFALADEADADGRDAIEAYALGFETACRVAEPISPEHYERGWHATATFGTFGAAAAAASLLDLDADGVERALNAAASMPAGTKQNFGSMTKPLHAGLAARSGVTAALLAAEGFTTGDRAISGDQGFWVLYGADDPDVAAAAADDEWFLRSHGVHTKKYPCCYFTHTSIAATRSLADERDLTPDDVERVSVRAAGGAGDALTYHRPDGELEAKFSMEHAVAVALARDRVGLSAFEEETYGDEAVRSLYDRVEFAVDESLAYDSHAATVEIETPDGTVSETREHPPWTHDDPPSEEELRGKFVACAERAVDEDVAAETYDRLRTLPERDLSALLDPL